MITSMATQALYLKIMKATAYFAICRYYNSEFDTVEIYKMDLSKMEIEFEYKITSRTFDYSTGFGPILVKAVGNRFLIPSILDGSSFTDSHMMYTFEALIFNKISKNIPLSVKSGKEKC